MPAQFSRSSSVLLLLSVLTVPVLLDAADKNGQGNAETTKTDSNEPLGHIVFVIGEQEYETEKTLPAFARKQLEPLGYKCSFVHADKQDRNQFPDMKLVQDADLVFLSVRRRTPLKEQLETIRKHLAAGKPLIGIRTASHAFALRNADPPAGYAAWTNFDQDVLGCHYQGHFRNKQGTDVTTQLRAEQHPIMSGIRNKAFHSGGTLYKSYDLGPRTKVLLRGLTNADGKPLQMPVAWTNRYGKSRIFYTSLGHKEEFDHKTFQQVLVNAVYWCLNKPVPGRGVAGSGRTAGESPSSRNVYNENAAGNEQVKELMKKFAGRGEVGDDSEPTPAEQAVKRFNLHDGFEMKLVATEPTVRQPLYMNWDDRGRMWVVQYLQYPFPAGLKVVKYDQYLRAVFDKVPPAPPNHFPGQDKITVLEDTNGDGTFDQAKDVITGLNIVSAVTVGRGGIWVLNPPYLLFYPDKNRDDVPDSDPEVHLRGFGLEDTHSVANSLKWGPDGWLYGANGSTTTGTVRSAVSRNVHFKGQCIWRYHPDTKVFEIYSEGGGNTFSLEIDEKGRVFSGTNNGSTRGMHYTQGGYAKKSWGKHGPLTNPYAFGYFEHMRHRGQNERFTQAFAIYDGGTFPKQFDHAVIAANALHNRVWASRLLPDTSTFRTEDIAPLVLTQDRWFRPVDCKVGPDGAVYLADWYDSRLTHVDPRDNWHKSSGRIYRLQPTQYKAVKPFDLMAASPDVLIKTLAHPNKWFRQKAVQVIGERKEQSLLPELKQLAQDQKNPHALEALWALSLLNGLTDELATQLLLHSDPHVRRWTVRLLGERRPVSDMVAMALRKLAIREEDGEVRSQLACTARRLSAQHGLPIVREMLTRTADADDLHIPMLLWWAIEAKAVTGRDAVLAFFDDNALWKLPIVQTWILERIMQRYAMEGGEANLETCARLLKLAPDEQSTRKLMTGLQAAFRGRKISGLPMSLQSALNEYQKTLGESELALALQLGDESAIKRALKIIRDPKADVSVRLLYIEILGQIKHPHAEKPFLALLAARGSGSHAIKRVALQALMNFENPSIGKAIVGRLYSSLPPENGVRDTAMRVLASRKAWALYLLDEVDQWRLKKEAVPLEIVQQLALHQDEPIQKLVKKHWGKIRSTTPAEKKEEMQRIARLLKSGTGSPENGYQIFKKTCAVCHELFGEGGSAGPKLTGYERDNLNFMLLAIVDPSAAIREEFTSFLVLTEDGRTVTGLIEKQDTRTITLRDVKAEQTLINRDEIEVLKALDTSLMPEGQTRKMTDQDVRDLFAYLMSRTPRSSNRSASR